MVLILRPNLTAALLDDVLVGEAVNQLDPRLLVILMLASIRAYKNLISNSYVNMFSSVYRAPLGTLVIHHLLSPIKVFLTW